MYAQIVPPIAPAEKLKLLANVELFSGFSEKQLVGVSHVAHVKTLERREELFHKGDGGGEIYVVASGKRKALTTGHGTILVVDDEKMVRTSTVRLLERLGYQVIQAENGKEAVQVYQEQPDKISLVLLDMAMPVMDGPETYRRLKQINPAIRALLFSGYSADATANGLMDEGAVGFIQKPFLLDKLADAVALALAG